MAYTKEQRAANAALKTGKTAKNEESAKVTEIKTEAKVETPAPTVKKPEKVTKIPLDTVVAVVCNTAGNLYYGARNGIVVEWDGYGTIQYMTIGDLVNMRNSSRRFFEDNWIIFEDGDDYTAEQIYAFLQVSKYYENVFTPDTLGELFELSAGEILNAVKLLSKGQKMTLIAKAREKVESKELDSNSKIEALEQALGVDLKI